MRFKLFNVRQSFMCYFVPEPFPDGNDPTPYYSGTYLLTPDSQLSYYSDDGKKVLPKKLPAKKELDKICEKLCNEKWAKKGPSVLAAIKLTGKIFMRDGNTKPDYDGFPGTFYISARSKIKPTLFDQLKQPIEEESGLLYSGCYVNVGLEAYPYTKGNKGLGSRLRGVQLLRKGEAFGGGGPPADEEEFDELEVDDSDETADDDSDSDDMMG